MWTPTLTKSPHPLLQSPVSYQAQETGTRMMLLKLQCSNSQAQKTLTGLHTNLPWGQRFFSDMAVSIGKVVHASCESCSWYVCETNQMTSHVHDFVNSKRHARKKPLLRGKTNPTSWNLTEVLFPGNKADTRLDEAPDITDSNKGTCRPA